MQKFFIYKDDQPLGPFSAEELVSLKITRDTMVWFEGSDNWQTAVTVEQLKDHFKHLPPPFKIDHPISEEVVSNVNLQDRRGLTFGIDMLKIDKPLLFAYLAIAIIAVFLGFFSIEQSGKQSTLLRELDEQHAKILILEKKEYARFVEEERLKQSAIAEKRKAEVEALTAKYNQVLVTLRAEKIALEELQSFRFLRTSSEKEAQIQSQLNTIRALENEVDRFKAEIDAYN
jgi:uncharacterized protein (DUF4415 family)